MDRPKSQNSAGTDNKEEAHGATTSKLPSSKPVSSSHNMNDLKMFDFNSADEIRSSRNHTTGLTKNTAPKYAPTVREAFSLRQAMKAMLSGNKLQNSGDEMKTQSTKADGQNSICNANKEAAGHVFKIVKSKEDFRSFSNNVRKKRPGRPPNAGPSKKTKRNSVTNLFVGKLKNVVKFKHCASESESDEYIY
ncbi:uncharacterized protein LOC128674226 [Plodia interpunctella]|uniref:uncharacterized protein LOC128674226 n=1 Tax=Plodia interpunctella TaxID=58824 RepID=UPI0023676C3C|nr:uncharacterized protein LOC128674226 [Plodia interpunctella]